MEKPKHCTYENYPCRIADMVCSGHYNSIELERSCAVCPRNTENGARIPVRVTYQEYIDNAYNFIDSACNWYEDSHG